MEKHDKYVRLKTKDLFKLVKSAPSLPSVVVLSGAENGKITGIS